MNEANVEAGGQRNIKHKIYARHAGLKDPNRLRLPLIKYCIGLALDIEGVDMPCEISVLVTNDHNIRALNREFRALDEATDVLSFPMLEFSSPGWETPDADKPDIETGLLPLGEIVFSGEKVSKQAQSYRRSREYETAYLTVHSVLHLLGYDHTDEAEGKRMMRGREEAIMSEIIKASAL